MFPLLWSINRGNLRSTGVNRLFAKPLRSHRSPSLASASSEWHPFMSAIHTRLLSSRSGMFRQEPLGFPMLAWLLRCRCLTRYCLRPREDEMALVFVAPPILPAPNKKGSAPSKISQFSGLRGRFRAHTLYLVRLANLLNLCEGCLRTVDYALPVRASFPLTTSNQSQVRTLFFVTENLGISH
jgi:hypothetical protein